MKSRFLLSAAFVLLPATAVSAQETTDAPAAPASETAEAERAAPMDGDIIVTARRRSESLQSVPVAVTAVSGEDLKDKGIANALDLAKITPSLTPTSVFSSNHVNFTIRGQAPENNNFGNNPTVEIYFDDVAQIYPSLGQIYDIDSVQVIRGPQGTLFGRASNGGAVLYAPTEPGNEFEGYVSGQIGNYRNREIEAAITIPIVSDVLSIRAAGNIVRRDGFTKVLNQNNFDLDDRHADAFRVTAKFTPTDWFTNTTLYDYSNVDSHQSAWQLIAARPTGLASQLYQPGSPLFANFLANNPSLASIPGVSGGLQAYLATIEALGARQVYYNTPASLLIYQNRVKNLINKMEFDLGGNVELKYVFGYQRMYVALGYEADATPFPILDMYQPTFAPTARASHKKQMSHEVQLSGTAFDGGLEWLVGGYYEERKDLVPGNTLFGKAFGGFFTGGATTVMNDIDTSSRALFTQATYNITDQIRLTGGIRYTWDRIRAQSYSAFTPTGPDGQTSGTSVCPGTATPFSVDAAACRGILTQQRPNDANWTASIDYRPNNSLLFYVSAKHGYRPGGVSTTVVVPALREYGPESITEYELGAKLSGDIGGVRGRLALATFQQDIKDAQRGVIIFNPLTAQAQGITVNAEKARVRGVELEGELVFSDYFRIGGFADYTDAKYQTFDVPVIGVDPTAPGGLAIVSYTDASANPFPNVPKYHASVNATVTIPTPKDMGKLDVHLNYFYQSRFTFAVQSDLEPEAFAKGYGLVNGRINWSDVLGAPIDASFFVNNLTNKTYRRGGIGLQNLLGITHASIGEPRTYGVELRYRF